MSVVGMIPRISAKRASNDSLTTDPNIGGSMQGTAQLNGVCFRRCGTKD